jgi:hypothetical protein
MIIGILKSSRIHILNANNAGILVAYLDVDVGNLRGDLESSFSCGKSLFIH